VQQVVSLGQAESEKSAMCLFTGLSNLPRQGSANKARKEIFVPAHKIGTPFVYFC